MAQNTAYEEEEYEEGLTFGKIGYFLKKGWLRMIVYIVVLALVATAIAVPIKVFYKSEPVAQTSIEFIYKGIEKGEAPDGSTLNTDDIITPSILSAAVDGAGLGGKLTDISTLSQSVRVESVETDEYVKLVEAAANGDNEAINTLRNYTMFPTRFNIVISDPDKLGLSDDQAKLLLNKIVEKYYEDFQKSYSVVSIFDSEMFVLSQSELLEFTDIYDMYVSALSSIKVYLTELASENPTFTSHKNNTTFNLLLSELSLINSNYELFNSFIIANNVWRSATTAKNSLEASQKTVMNNMTSTQKYIDSIKEQIAAIKYDVKPEIEAPSGGQILVNYPSYPAVYNTLNSQLEAATREMLDYNIQLENIKTRLEQINTSGAETSDEDKASALQTIATLETQTAEFVRKANATIEDYYDTTFISSSVRQVQPPVVTRRSSELSLMIVYLVAVIAGLLIACVVTGVKIARKNNADKRKAAQSEITEEADGGENA